MEMMSVFDPSKWISGFTNNAEQIGKLSAQATLALVALGEAVYIAWDSKAQNRARELSQEIRLKDAESDILMAKAVDKLADEIRFKIKGVNNGTQDVA